MPLVQRRREGRLGVEISFREADHHRTLARLALRTQRSRLNDRPVAAAALLERQTAGEAVEHAF